MHSMAQYLVRSTRPASLLLPGLVLLSLAAVPFHGVTASGYPPPTECPQPRFTGEAPEPLRSTPNPLSEERKHIKAGGALYQQDAQPRCAMCHGREGDGRGPLSAQFDPRPRNFACAETVNGIPDGQLFWIVKNGSPGTAMPPFGNKLSDEQIWQIVLYLRQLAN